MTNDLNIDQRNEKKLLVIDDDVSILETLDFILSDNGYHVLLASDGDEGLSIIQSQWIDGIILDLRMPKTSGYFLANIIPQESLNPDTKVLLLSAEALMIGEFKLAVPNIIGKMTKPFDVSELKKQVQLLLND